MLKIVVLACLIVGILIGQTPRPLAKDQVEQLIRVLPDKALAREIRQRGVAFKVDGSVLNHFSDIGAGAETMEALREIVTTAQLVIFTVPPNCDISLNEHVIGRTDDAGKLVVSELDAGPMQLWISRDGYRSRTYNVSLAPNKPNELRASLERATGFLLVSTDPLDASVVLSPSDPNADLDGPAPCKAQPSQRNAWECVTTEYIIKTSHDGFFPGSETVRIFDGQTTQISVSLLRELSVSDVAAGRARGAPASADSPASGTPRSRDVDALRLLGIVQNAMGGAANLTSVRDWQQRAKEIWKPSNGTTEATTTFAAPSSLREESTGGNRTANYSDGAAGWTWSSSRPGVRELPSDTATGMLFRTLNTLLLSDGDPERTINLTSPDTMVFSDAHHDRATLTIDTRSHLPRTLSWLNLDGAVLVETYSDWRKIGGVMWWFRMTRARNGITFLEVDVKDYRVNAGLNVQDLGVSPERSIQPPPRRSPSPSGGRAVLKTDGDRRGTLVLFNDHIEYRDDGMGTNGGKAPYGPNSRNNFTLFCSDIQNIKAYGFRPTLFGSFEVVISSGRRKFHIPALRSASVATAIRDACGIAPGNEH